MLDKNSSRTSHSQVHKSCPKCGARIYVSEDRYGRYEECIQCGYEYDLGVDKEKQQQQVEKLNRELGVII